MVSSTIHLPDGQTYTVQSVFAGLFFKSHDLNRHHPHQPFPIGWTIVINTEETDDAASKDGQSDSAGTSADKKTPPASPALVDDSLEPSALERGHIHSFTKPSLQNDTLYISSISNPSDADFKPPASPTRQIAMMLWITLYWYFHQPAPSKVLPAVQSSRHTAPEGRPRGDWRVHIKRDGVLRGRNLIPKLERMGLIASLDSAVGSSLDDAGDEWASMYVSQRMFWQIPGRLFLFTLQPNAAGSSRSHPGSPVSSRPGSPVSGRQLQPRQHQPAHDRNGAGSPHRGQQPLSSPSHLIADVPGAPPPQALLSSPGFPISPFYSSSHLPTYYPPPPLQYTFTEGVRHPVRPKPPRQGEVFYTRFVPSVGRYLSFRVASTSNKPIPYLGPVSSSASAAENSAINGNSKPVSDANAHPTSKTDTELMQMWLSKPRVAKFWGGFVPDFLTGALANRHSFPAIGMWDGVPFGYFEIYWVKEDILGRQIDADDFDRGIHVFVGEEWARGRVQAWLSSLCHWIFCADNRTNSVSLEPRVDNER